MSWNDSSVSLLPNTEFMIDILVMVNLFSSLVSYSLLLKSRFAVYSVVLLAIHFFLSYVSSTPPLGTTSLISLDISSGDISALFIIFATSEDISVTFAPSGKTIVA